MELQLSACPYMKLFLCGRMKEQKQNTIAGSGVSFVSHARFSWPSRIKTWLQMP
ncbi:DUF2759 domain-containing protein [Sesbania bispinosa]|nr:DUF2759 domain-containing protein [Sesbania bispinosa]